MQYLHSISAYADHLLDNEALPSDIVAINRMNDEGTYAGHRHTIARDFRNRFGLWNQDHPLTKNWHTNAQLRDIRGGVDFSADHPDSISMRILEAFEAKILRNPLKSAGQDFIYHTKEGSVTVVNGIATVNPKEAIPCPK